METVQHSLERFVASAVLSPGEPLEKVAERHTKELYKAAVQERIGRGGPRLSRRQEPRSGHRCKLHSDGVCHLEAGSTEPMRVGPAKFLPAAVHARVPRKRWKEPGAQEAFDKEWKKLENAPWPTGKGVGA